MSRSLLLVAAGVFAAASLHAQSPGDTAPAFQAKFQMPFPVLLDEKGKTRKFYRLRGVPTSVFVGSDGVVRAVHQGPIDGAALERHLSKILRGRQG